MHARVGRGLALAVLVGLMITHQAAASRHLSDDTLLSKEEIQKFTDGLKTKDGYLVVGVANHGHLKFAINFAEGMRRNIGPSVPFLIVCMDKRSYTHLKARDIPVLRIDNLNTTYAAGDFDNAKLQAESTYMEPNYLHLTNLKVDIVYDLVATYQHNVIFTDLDLVWVNPGIVDYLHNMFTTWEYDVIMAMDNYATRTMSSGFYAVRNTEHARTVMKWCIDNPDRLGAGDQDHFNNYYYLVMPAAERLRWGQLPILLFATGHVFLDGLFDRFHIKPWMLHANYVIGSHAKQDLLARAGLWYLE